MAATDAQIAKMVVGRAPTGVFARAVLPAVTRQDFTELERMLPGMRFGIRKTGQDSWELAGTAADGSTCLWEVGA